MKIYITICQDRHIDPDIQVFTDKQAAIDYAWEYMRAHVAHPVELQDTTGAGEVLSISYEPESDYALVVEREIEAQV